MNRQLGQLRPANTSAASIFSPDTSGPYEAALLVITNVTTSAADASFFHDKNGTTYDETTALLFGHSIAAGDVVMIEGPFGDYEEAGNFGVQSSVADALNFTLYGTIERERL